MMKKCNKCGRLLDETMFHKDKASNDGLTNTCRDCKKAYDEKYRSIAENKERQKKYNKEYFSKTENKERAKELRNLNRENYLNYMKQYHQKDENKQREYELRKQKYDNDLNYRLDILMVNRFGQVLSRKIKQSPTIEKYLSYTAQQLREHIKSQFTPEMNWGNYGTYWELDHIIPRFKFYYESYDDEQFKQCWALSNLRPLEVKVNRCRSKT